MMDENEEVNDKALDSFMEDVLKVMDFAEQKEEQNIKQKAAKDLHDMYVDMQQAGFTEAQAFQITLTMVSSCFRR